MKQFRSVGRTKSPCFECQDRKSGCHADCDRYALYKEVHESEVEEIKKKRHLESLGFGPRMTDKQFKGAVNKSKNRVLKQHMK